MGADGERWKCDDCGLAIPARAVCYETEDGRILCAGCEADSRRGHLQTFLRRRRRQRLISGVLAAGGVIVPLLVALLVIRQLGRDGSSEAAPAAALPTPPVLIAGNAAPLPEVAPAIQPARARAVPRAVVAEPLPLAAVPRSAPAAPVSTTAAEHAAVPVAAAVPIAAAAPAAAPPDENEPPRPVAAMQQVAETPPGVPPPAEAERPGQSALRPRPATDRSRLTGRYRLRGLGRHGPPEARIAAAEALDWLVRHQAPDGRWGCAGFTRQCKRDSCQGAGDESFDVGVTGLALLAFLAAGHTADQGEHQDAVRRGLLFLCGRQDPATGCFGRVGTHTNLLYEHAIATQAVAEGYGLSDWPALRPAVQRGVYFIQAARNPGAAWRYSFPPDGTNDVSITGWMVAALVAARDFGFEVDPAALDGAAAFIETMTDPRDWRTGYVTRGGLSAREAEGMDRWPADRTEAMTAVALACRLACGQKPTERALRGGAALLLAKPPYFSPPSGSIDYYYWYYGTHALHALGGDPWQEWEKQLLVALLDHQVDDGDARGSFDPQFCPWGHRGGRVYATALLALCLEVYERFDPAVRSQFVPTAAAAGDSVVPAGVVSDALAKLLAEVRESKDSRTRLVQLAAKLGRHAARRDGVERVVARLFEGRALAAAGDMESASRPQDRADKYRKAALALKEAMDAGDDVDLGGTSARVLAATLRLRLHEDCVRWFKARLDEGEPGYSGIRFKNDAGWHERGIQECRAVLDG